MKNPLDYLSLWQKKRNELPVDTSLEQDWVKMRSVLDKQLPSVPKASGSHGGLGAGGLKALSVLIVAVSAAVAVYHFKIFLKRSISTIQKSLIVLKIT